MAPPFVHSNVGAFYEKGVYKRVSPQSLDLRVLCDLWAVVKVREIIRELESDGWFQVRYKGSHRQLHHEVKPGTVTVPGALGDDLHRELLGSIVRQAGLERRKS